MGFDSGPGPGQRCVLTWQLQASVCGGGPLQWRRLRTVHHLAVKGVGLPVQHRQSQSQPLSVRLGSDAKQRVLKSGNRKQEHDDDKMQTKNRENKSK